MNPFEFLRKIRSDRNKNRSLRHMGNARARLLGSAVSWEEVRPDREMLSEILRNHKPAPGQSDIHALAATPTAHQLASANIGLAYPLDGIATSYRDNHFIADIQDMSESIVLRRDGLGSAPTKIKSAALLLAVCDRLGAEEKEAFLDLVAIACFKERNPRLGTVGVFSVRKNH